MSNRITGRTSLPADGSLHRLFALVPKIAAVKQLDGFATYDNVFYMLDERQVKTDPKI
jgi:hypothetical protein